MNPLRQLISQTAIYGLSSIIGRFLNYLLVPLYTYYFSTAEYGVVSEFYAYAGFFAVLLVFGLETGFFRFREQQKSASESVYSTALSFVITANLIFVGSVYALSGDIAAALRYDSHPEYIIWFTQILAIDSVAALPFAKLRAENRALRFASLKVAEIIITIGLNLFFIVYCRHAYENAPGSVAGRFYDPTLGVGYIFISNLVASAVKILLLRREFRALGQGFDFSLFRKMIRYSMPMVIIGLAGIVNEMLDRAILKYLLPYDPQTNLQMLGIYGACYKLSILMTLFIQAFRYAGEPFFFAHARRADAQRTYADVLKYFVIFCVFVFLLVTLYIDIFKYFIGKEFRVGLNVVPILLMANLLFGIYVNLSVWYKLTDRTGLGAAVASMGAVITVILNVWWIPIMGYIGAAWATLCCYASMTLISYLLSRKYYPVPYDIKRILGYIALGMGLYFANPVIVDSTQLHPLASATLLMLLYWLIVLAVDVRKAIYRQPA